MTKSTSNQTTDGAPTHWMDDRGYVVSDEFLNSERSSSDWRDAYNIPGTMKRGKFVAILKATTKPPEQG